MSAGAQPSPIPVVGDEAIRIEGLHKSFGTNEVLRGIDLSVATHEVVCLIGAWLPFWRIRRLDPASVLRG